MFPSDLRRANGLPLSRERRETLPFEFATSARAARRLQRRVSQLQVLELLLLIIASLGRMHAAVQL
jgi:hypothetical protein